MYKLILALGTTQTLGWASGYYIPAIIAEPAARDLAISPNIFFVAFSISLLISALLGPRVGHTIDMIGGRGVLAVSNLVFAAGLALLGQAHSTAALLAAWAIIGVAMGLGLYDAAFAALGRIYGAEARAPITGITLMAGFASTIGWPLTAWGVAEVGWRDTCLMWAAAHILIGLPLNLLMVPKVARKPPIATASLVAADAASAPAGVVMDRAMWLLAFAFASAWVVTAAMATHMPRLLQSAGAGYAEAIFAASLLGPAQVAARFAELSLGRYVHPLASARLAAFGHPLGAALLLLLGAKLAIPFSLLHGAGNGVLTIARGTVPLAVFGPEGFGYRIGLLGAPSRIAQAFAPALFGLLIDWIGLATLLVTSALSLAALAALMLVPHHITPRPPPVG